MPSLSDDQQYFNTPVMYSLFLLESLDEFGIALQDWMIEGNYNEELRWLIIFIA